MNETGKTPKELEDHISIINADSENNNMTSFESQAWRVREHIAFHLWNGCIFRIMKTVHKSTMKQSLSGRLHISFTIYHTITERLCAFRGNSFLKNSHRLLICDPRSMKSVIAKEVLLHCPAST